jgi:hypothetical protein
MSSNVPSVEEDLAYLRRVVDSDHGARVRYKFGVVYLICGLLWGPYALIVWAGQAKFFTLSERTGFLLWLVVMILFVALMIWGSWPRRGELVATVPTRAFGAAFAGIGYSYLIMLGVLMWAAHSRQNPVFIFVYCVVVFAGQGAGWYVFWVLRRERWIGLVAVGWYVAALTTGFNMRMPEFLLCVGFAMLLLMAVPGFAMIRRNPEAAR